MIKKFCAVALMFFIFILPAFAVVVDGGIYTSGVGKYLWRGAVLNNGPAIQSGLSFGAQGASLGIWTSCQQALSPDLFDEIDLIANYEHSIPYADFLSLAIGYMSYFRAPYNYPFLTPSQEISITLKSDIISTPFITWYHSLDALRTYNYMEAGVSYEYEIGALLNGKNAVGVSAVFGLDLNQVTYDNTDMVKIEAVTMTVAGFNIYYNYKIAGFTITPSAFFQLSLNKYKNSNGSKLYSNNTSFSLMANYDFTMGSKEKSAE